MPSVSISVSYNFEFALPEGVELRRNTDGDTSKPQEGDYYICLSLHNEDPWHTLCYFWDGKWVKEVVSDYSSVVEPPVKIAEDPFLEAFKAAYYARQAEEHSAPPAEEEEEDEE